MNTYVTGITIQQLRGMYDENDDNTQVFYFKNAVATFSSFSGAPETVEF